MDGLSSWHCFDTDLRLFNIMMFWFTSYRQDILSQKQVIQLQVLIQLDWLHHRLKVNNSNSFILVIQLQNYYLLSYWANIPDKAGLGRLPHAGMVSAAKRKNVTALIEVISLQWSKNHISFATEQRHLQAAETICTNEFVNNWQQSFLEIFKLGESHWVKILNCF